MYFQSILDPSSNAYFQQLKFVLSGALDPVSLAHSFQDLVDRHDVLRTIVTNKNAPQPLMVFLKQKENLWQFTDLSELKDQFKKTEIQRITREDLKQGFDYSKGNLFRIHLIRTSVNSYELIISFHHLLMDGLSFPILHQDLFEFYRSRIHKGTPGLKPVPSYARYLAWWKNRDFNSDKRFWEKYLAGYEEKSEIPSTARYTKSDNQLELHSIRLDPMLSDNIKAISREYGVTMNHVILSIWGVLLSRLTDNNDVVFGITINGRPRDLPGTENMIGLFINTLPFRVKIENTSFAELMQQSRDAFAEINEHQYLPLADIQNYSEAGNQLLQHILVFEGYQDGNDEHREFLPGVMAEEYSIYEQTHYALEVSIFPEERIRLRFGYDPKRLSQWDIETLGLRFQYIAEKLVHNPTHPLSEHSILSENEKALILEKYSRGGQKAVDHHSLVEAFDATCVEHGERIAVSDDQGISTYHMLHQQTLDIAYNLQNQQVKYGDRVVLLISRSRFLPAVLLGVLRAGAVYVPLSTETPLLRIQTILEDTKPALILTDIESFVDAEIPIMQLSEALFPVQKNRASFPVLQKNDSAYIIYTSGSTGKPKGVEISHGNLLSFFTNLDHRFGLNDRHRLLALTTYTFDISGLELLGTIINGTEVVICGDSSFINPNSILQLIKNKKCSAIQITPSHLAVLLDSDDQDILTSLELLLVGGEVLPDKLAGQLSQFPHTRVINVYGPTETTIWSTSADVISEDVSIGKPLLNETTQIITKDGQIAPIGVLGKLLIGGEGLSKGYWHDSPKTDAVFSDYTEPFNGKFYNTGDLARWLPDGSLEFFGRNDNQIKIRGFRVELGEIEQRLSSIEGIKVAVVVYDPEQKLLHAFLSLDNKDIKIEGLSEKVQLMLPGYMVPASYHSVDSYPLNSSGKIDRKKLLDSLAAVEIAEETLEPAQDDEEKLLAEIFSQLFPGQLIGRNSDFFELGGHSLKAMALVSRIQKLSKVELSLHEVFSKPRLMDLAMSIRMAEETSDRPIPVLSRQDIYELSNSQKRFWVLDQLEPDYGHLYLMGGVSLLKGRINRDAFVKTFQQLMSRHDVLRTSFTEIDGVPYQVINESDSIPLFEYDFSKSGKNAGLDSTNLEAKSNYDRAMEYIYQEMDEAFDLTKPPLWKIVLIHLEPDKHLLLLKIHHIICDASSIHILEKEFTTLYRSFSEPGHESVLEDMSIQQKEYSVWQNSRFSRGVFNESGNYWRALLAGDVTSLDLPQDHPRPVNPSYAGDTEAIVLSKHLACQLKSFSHQESVTLFTLYSAISSVLLGRLAQQEKMVLLCPVSGRNHPSVENTVGLFVNTVPLVLSPESNQRFQDYLQHARGVVEEAILHSQYPFDKLVDLVEKEREINRPPISGIMLVLDEASGIEETIDSVAMESVRLKMNMSRMDITFNLSITSQGTELSVTYSKDLFHKYRMVAMLQQWIALAEAAMETPEKRLSTLPLFNQSIKDQILSWSRGSRHVQKQSTTICGLVDRVAAQQAHVSAIVDGSATISYDELKSVSDQYALALSNHKHFTRQRPVAVLMDRTPKVVIAMLAIMKAGGIFLPLDKKVPAHRNRIILQESNVAMLILDSECGNDLKGFYSIQYQALFDSGEQHEILEEAVLPDDSAYMIFTSGSTGVPKGVLVSHRSFVNMINYQIRTLEIDSSDRILQFASFAFDAALAETFQALGSGATLAIAGDDIIADPVEFLQFMRSQNISVATLPPAYLHTLNKESLGHLRLLMTAGDEPIVEDVIHYRKKYRYFNAYGPTEFSVCGTLHEVGKDHAIEDEIPMGQAVAHCAVYVLDKNRQLLPVGVIGEIYLAGEGVAQGYINRPEENSASFLDDPFQSGWKMYKTGDLGVWDENGQLYFKGRSDFQVKIRGYRIEIEEIEKALKSLEAIDDALILEKEYSDGRKGLNAYLTGDRSCGYDFIQESLADTLPEYMIPSNFIFVDQFPLNVNGKVDRQALLSMGAVSEIAKESSETFNPLERQVAKVWQDVLEQKISTPSQHFFKSGGDSLAAIQMTTLLSRVLKHSVPVRTIFQYPLLSDFAFHADKASRAPAPTDISQVKIYEPRGSLSGVESYDEALENLISKGLLAPLHSVALSYYSDELTGGTGLSEARFLELMKSDIHLRYHITTPHGVIGVIQLPRFSSTIYTNKTALLMEIMEALKLAGKHGASHVSLTGLIPSATDYGQDIVNEVNESGLELPIITTGHDTTAASVLCAVEKMLATSGRKIENLRVAFLGMGSVGKSVFELMLDQMPGLHEVMLADLYVNEQAIEIYVKEMINKYPHFKRAELVLSEGGVSEKIYEADLIIGATNVPDIVDVHKFKKGVMIVDDSGPHCFSIDDAIQRLNHSRDILFTEGGVLKSKSAFKVSAFLPREMEKYLEQKGVAAFDNFPMDRITGCVLSGLIDHCENRNRNTTGPVKVNDSRSQYLKLKAWGIESAPLHAGQYEISEDQIIDYLRVNHEE